MSASTHRVSRLGLVNAYLVVEEDGLTLIDTTVGGGAERILGAAKALGAPILRIALTHAHYDHVGSLDVLAAKLPEAEILISERDAAFLAGDKSHRTGEGGKFQSYKQTQAQPTRNLAPGDRVGSLEVVDAPGHTPGHLAFLDTRDRTLYCGDAYGTLGGLKTSAKASLPIPLPALGTWNKPLALESAVKLRALDPSALAPGHGKVVENPGAAMDRAIATAS